MNDVDYADLAARVRAWAVQMTYWGHSGHVGSSLSMADLLAVLYGRVLRVDPANPRWPERDRFLLSKGHAAAGVYAVLAEKGFIPREWLRTYYQDGGRLSGHISHYVPGVEFSTGSLGHGLPVGVGMALHAKRRGLGHRVFVLMSDGDVNEGSTWEAIMFAAQHHLDNLIGIVDYNRVQALGHSEDIIDMEPFAPKWRDFGWSVQEIDGHDFAAIERSLLTVPHEAGKPSAIIAHTIKGRGCSFMEDDYNWHYRHCNDELLAQALAELGMQA